MAIRPRKLDLLICVPRPGTIFITRRTHFFPIIAGQTILFLKFFDFYMGKKFSTQLSKLCILASFWKKYFRKVFPNLVEFFLQDWSYLLMTLFSINEIATLLVFWGSRYFDPMELQDWPYFEDDVILNQWSCKIGSISGMKIFLTNKIAALVVFWGWLFSTNKIAVLVVFWGWLFSTNETAVLVVFWGWRYFQPMKPQYW